MKRSVHPIHANNSLHSRPPRGKISLLGAGLATSSDDMDNVLSMMERLLHWAAIIDSSDDAIISKSIDGYITSWNRGAQELYGYRADEVIGKPVSILMPPEREDDFPKIMKQLQEGKKVDHYETKRQTKDGRILDVSITVSPIRDMHGTIIGASKIARDISERKAYEQRRSNFISTVSHELNTPITTQQIYGELLERLLEENGDQQSRAVIKKMNAQTAKLARLVRDLLDIARMESGRLKMEEAEFSLDELIEDVAQDMRLSISRSLLIEGNLGVPVIGDRERLSQVLINLITNATKYSPRNRKIRVIVGRDGSRAIVAVKDRGRGIAKKEHQKIFERFYRVEGEDEKTYPGMGIGLNFCHEIIERHGGNIWVDSQIGKGSTFTFALPLRPLNGEDMESL